MTGKLASVSSPGGVTLTYTYDGSLLTRTTWSGPVSGTVERTYDNDFRMISEKVNGGTLVTYEYDADGLLKKAGDLTITRDPHTGLVAGTALGVVTTTNGYNAFGELIRQEAVDTNAELSTEGLWRFGQIVKGGWKDQDWLEWRHDEYKDFTWDELFNTVPLLPPATPLPECR